MRCCCSLLLLGWLTWLPGPVHAAASSPARTVTYLTTLARVWGLLKYQHPGIARHRLDWDSTLVVTLPRVQAAPSAHAVNAELRQWLTVLGPLPATTASWPPDLLPAPAQASWLTQDPVLEPALRTALQQVLQCHAVPVSHPYVRTTTNGILTHQERAYADQLLPSEAYRLLGLFRYWNIIEYFYPYKEGIARTWSGLLSTFIPRFQQAATPLAYHLLLLELVAQLHDTHGFVFHSPVLTAHFGDNYPPLELGVVEGQIVVTRLYAQLLPARLPLQVGDVVEQANGVPVQHLLTRYAPYVAASTPAAWQRDVLRFVLRGQAADSLALTVRASTGHVRTVHLPRPLTIRSLTEATYKEYYFDRNWPDTTSWRLLAGNIGYVHLGTLRFWQLAPAMQHLRQTKGLILDLRTYPQVGGAELLSPYLQPAGRAYATFTHPVLAYSGYLAPGPTYVTPTGPVGLPAPYAGKIVVLVNEKTQSAAELSAMLLQIIPGAIVVGSQTAGADGNIVQVVLPGGVETYYSGVGVYYPDGRATQRVGIVPTLRVSPTLAGLRAGQDEVLARALAYLAQP